MAVPTVSSLPPKLKVPEPAQFATPKVQTAADVRTSQNVTGGVPAPSSSPTVTSASTKAASSVQPPEIVKQTPQPVTGTTTKPPVESPTVSSAPTPKSTYGATGGTAAPTPAPAGSPDAGMPNTAAQPNLALMPTPESIIARNEATTDLSTAEAENAQKLYQAATAYNGGPNSALALAQLAAETQNATSVGNRGAAGTVNSSLRGEDQTKIANNKARADLKGYEDYQKAITEANDALTKARQVYERSNEKARLDEIKYAEERERETPGKVASAEKSGAKVGTKVPISKLVRKAEKGPPKAPKGTKVKTPPVKKGSTTKVPKATIKAGGKIGKVKAGGKLPKVKTPKPPKISKTGGVGAA